MPPFTFVAGEEDRSSKQDIECVEQTITTLPNHLDVNYDAETKVVTVRFTGKSSLCLTDFDNAKKAYLESGSDPDADAPVAAPAPEGSGSAAPTSGEGRWSIIMMTLALVMSMSSSSWFL